MPANTPLSRLQDAPKPSDGQWRPWFVAHKEDLLTQIKIAGWETTAELIGAPKKELYAWKYPLLGADHPHGTPRDVQRPAVAPAPSTPPIPPALPAMVAPRKAEAPPSPVAATQQAPAPALVSKHHGKEGSDAGIPQALWRRALRLGWSAQDVDKLMHTKLKAFPDRTEQDWADLATIVKEHPNLFADIQGKPLTG